MAAAIELRDVCVAYPAGVGEPRDVLTGVTSSVAGGTFCALLGPNGSGKSTLLRVVAGRISPRRGNVAIRGRALHQMGNEERAQTIAIVPQRCEMAFGFTVRQVVAMGRSPYQGAFMRERHLDAEVVETALVDCSLVDLKHRPVTELSGGEQQRVHVARALAQEPEILLLDEAAAHLDVRHQEVLYSLVRAQIQRRGLTCVAAMHDFNAALRHADTALVLAHGKVAGDGPARQILEPGLLGRVFGVPIATGTFGQGQPVLVVTGLGPVAADGPGSPESVPDGRIDL